MNNDDILCKAMWRVYALGALAPLYSLRRSVLLTLVASMDTNVNVVTEFKKTAGRLALGKDIIHLAGISKNYFATNLA